MDIQPILEMFGYNIFSQTLHIGILVLISYLILMLFIGPGIGCIIKAIDDGDSEIFKVHQYNYCPIHHFLMWCIGFTVKGLDHTTTSHQKVFRDKKDTSHLPSRQDDTIVFWMFIFLLPPMPAITALFVYLPLIPILLASSITMFFLLRSGRRTQKKITKHINDTKIHISEE